MSVIVPSHRCKFSLSAVMLALAPLLSCTTRADHGQNFLLLQDTEVSAPGAGHLLDTFSWENYDGQDSFGLSPGFNIGILPRVSLSVHTSFEDEGDGMSFRSVLPELQIQLTSPKTKLPFRLAFSAGYQFADGSHKESSRSVVYVQQKPAKTSNVVSQSTPAVPSSSVAAAAPPLVDPAPTPVDPGPDAPIDLGPDAPRTNSRIRPRHGEQITPAPAPKPVPAPAAVQPAVSSGQGSSSSVKKAPAVLPPKRYEYETPDHYHSAAHNHDDELFTARIILEADLTPSTLFVFNLISVIPEDGDEGWAYAAGVRHTVSRNLALGLEALGDFDSRGQHQLLGAAYWTPVHHYTLKIGAGCGLTGNSPDFSVRAGFVWEWH